MFCSQVCYRSCICCSASVHTALTQTHLEVFLQVVCGCATVRVGFVTLVKLLLKLLLQPK